MTDKFVATFDLLAHELPCDECGSTPSNAAELDMQTKIATVRTMTELRVGSRVDIPPDLASSDWYLRCGHSQSSGTQVIEHWTCPTCAAWQWARVAVADGVLTSIEPVALDEPTLETSDYITGVVALLFPLEEVHGLARVPLAELRARIVVAEGLRRKQRAEDLRCG